MYSNVALSFGIGGIFILRVISGTAKGHKLKTLDNQNTRPTADRVKESLFNIISGYIKGAFVLDLYAGTGNLGIEALSRGAEFCVFIDKSTQCDKIIYDNLVHTKLVDFAKIIVDDVIKGLNKALLFKSKFDIIFIDPPYSKDFIPFTLDTIVSNSMLSEGGIIIAERNINDVIPDNISHLSLFREQKYGDTILGFYRFN